MSETKDPHKPKFDIATRAQAMTLRHCGYSFKNIEQQTGIAERQLQHIIRTAKKHGYDSEKSFRLEDCHFPDGHKTGRPRKFTEEQALELLAAAQPNEDGTKKTNATLAKEFGVSERTVRRRRVQLEEEHGKPEKKKKSRPRPKPQSRPAPASIDQQQQQQQNGIKGTVAPQAQMHGGLQQQQQLPQDQQHNQQHQNQSFDSIQSTATPVTTDGGEEHNFEARLIEQLQQEQQQQQHHHQPEIGMYQYPPPSYHTPGPLGHPSHSLSPGGQHGGH